MMGGEGCLILGPPLNVRCGGCVRDESLPLTVVRGGDFVAVARARDGATGLT